MTLERYRFVCQKLASPLEGHASFPRQSVRRKKDSFVFMTITPTISYLSMNVIKRNSGHKKKSSGQKTNFSSVFSARFQIYSSGWRDNAIVTWGNLEKSERFSSGCETKTKENNNEDGIPVRSIHQLSYWPTLYRDSEALLGWRYQRTWSASFWSVFCFLVYWGPQLRTQWNREFLARCAVKRWFKKKRQDKHK